MQARAGALRTRPAQQLTHRHAFSGADRFEPNDRLLRLQGSIGNQAVAQLLRASVDGHAMHAPSSVLRATLIQRCGPTPCNCSAAERAEKEGRAAKPKPPQCGVVSPDEMGSDAVAEVNNATDDTRVVSNDNSNQGATDDDETVAKQLPTWMPQPNPRLTEANMDGFRHPAAGGAATIVCDGNGGYRVALNDWAGAPCGTESCVTKHESQHIADWKKRWPDGCKPKADHADGSDIPLGGDGYDAFLNDSECKAHTVDLACADDLLKTARGDCKAKVQHYRDLTAEQKKSYC
jgi:hypothetical protein